MSSSVSANSDKSMHHNNVMSHVFNTIEEHWIAKTQRISIKPIVITKEKDLSMALLRVVDTIAPSLLVLNLMTLRMKSLSLRLDVP